MLWLGLAGKSLGYRCITFTILSCHNNKIIIPHVHGLKDVQSPVCFLLKLCFLMSAGIIFTCCFNLFPTCLNYCIFSWSLPIVLLPLNQGSVAELSKSTSMIPPLTYHKSIKFFGPCMAILRVMVSVGILCPPYATHVF